MKNSNNKKKVDDLFVGKLILAPMAGICDLPFRMLCKEQGCDVLYTEMISAKGMHYKNKNSIPLLMTDSIEKPIGAQIFGNDPEIMSEQSKAIESIGFDFIDINMGCPVPKIVNNNEGSALMRDELLVAKIVEKVSKSIKIPLTVKIRSGFSKEHINAPQIAKIAQESGASAIAVHGRTREDYYLGKADWEVIAKVKKEVSIPVIGNGDITNYEDIVEMKKITNCDSFMIGRAAKGNPWIFSEIKSKIIGVDRQRPSINEIIDMIFKHAKLMVELKGEYTGIHEMRKHISWYTVGLKDSAKLRSEINKLEKYSEIETLLYKFIKK